MRKKAESAKLSAGNVQQLLKFVDKSAPLSLISNCMSFSDVTFARLRIDQGTLIYKLTTFLLSC
jgi:hypothetical protein